MHNAAAHQARAGVNRPDSVGTLVPYRPAPYHREGGTLRHNGGSLDHGWTQKGFVLLIVLSTEAEDLTLAQWLPTTATTSNQ